MLGYDARGLCRYIVYARRWWKGKVLGLPWGHATSESMLVLQLEKLVVSQSRALTGR